MSRILIVAQNTFREAVRDRVLYNLVFFALLMIASAVIVGQISMDIETIVMVSLGLSAISLIGLLIAVFTGVGLVSKEIDKRTLHAVLAKPLRRWEFLLGKYLGVLLLMGCYVVMMFGLSYLLAWMGGQRVLAASWILLTYPMVRYAIYAAIAMAVATLAHPVLSWVFTLLLGLGAMLVAPGEEPITKAALRWLSTGLYYLLPSTQFLSEDRFLNIKQATLRQTGWAEHLLTLTYGVDYALVVLLLAMWSFHYRSLKRD